MSTSVLVAIAGLMVTAVGTGPLAGRCIRSPRPSFIAWTIGMFALTVALLAQSIGFATGFGAVTFRVVQVSVQLVAPVALAWGLVELVARGPAARFGARLASAGLLVVAGVILATDPLAARPFGTVWPSAAVHYQLIPHYALIGLHLAVVAVAAAAVALCAVEDRGRPAGGQLLPGAAAVGGAVLAVVALRFGLPADAAYPALTALSGGLVWFGLTRADGLASAAARPRAVPSRDAGAGYRGQGAGVTAGTGDGQWEGSQWLAGPWTGQDAPDRAGGRSPADGRAGGPAPANATAEARARSGPGASGGPSGSRAAAQPGDATDDRGMGSASRCAGPGERRDGPPRPRAGSGRPGTPEPYGAAGTYGVYGAHGAYDAAGPYEAAAGTYEAGPYREPGGPGAAGVAGSYGMTGAEPAAAGAGRPGSALSRRPAPGEAPAAAPAGGTVRAVTRPHGLIAIYTLLEDRVADFDRIADQAAEQVRASEPDTLVYVIHTVPKAPMQRIFYEVYRDRAAYEHHEQQPYVKRFVTARRPYVLATNVIELRLKYAKVSPLVQAEAPVRAPAGTLPAAGPAAPAPTRARPAPGEPGQRRYGGI
jgi:quinol monooxygenase YgiN